VSGGWQCRRMDEAGPGMMEEKRKPMFKHVSQ
jgi:hypothetical protein